MANVTKHTDTRTRSGIFEPAHLIIPRYATAPPDAADGEVWFDVTNNALKINKEGTVYLETMTTT